jgi:hypothetical protein
MYGRVWLMGTRRALFVTFVWLLLALPLVGCAASAQWATVHVAPGYHPPRSVTLKVSDTLGTGQAGALEMALVEAFSDLDIHATPLDDESSKPTLRVVIEKWDPGSETARRLLGPVSLGGVGEGEIVFDVQTFNENGEPAIQGKARSSVDATTEKSLRAIAELTANMVAKGAEGSRHPAEAPHSAYP